MQKQDSGLLDRRNGAAFESGLLGKLRSKLSTHPEAYRANAKHGSTHYELIGCESFTKTLHVEQKRAERSSRALVLMLVELGKGVRPDQPRGAFQRALRAVSQSMRETDIKGWYREGSVIGIVFTEVPSTGAAALAETLRGKVSAALSSTLSKSENEQVHLTCYVYPEDWQGLGEELHAGMKVSSRVNLAGAGKKLALTVKALMDVTGSLLAVVLLAPFLAVIAITIKLTSKGPILFRQQRVGQFGKPFVFFKFRSMYTANDPAIHQDYVQNYIKGSIDSDQSSKRDTPVFKLQNDPRITPIGRFLRKTSLDELPQFFNVLRGEMSLVGPRPPIAYEVDCYKAWHTRRLRVAKPGLTGLWQVNGRSRTTFNEMVRLDLQYAESWSLWLDLKILLRTPLVMVTGGGGY